MGSYIEDIDSLFEQTQSKLQAHYSAFVDRVKKKFEREIKEHCIEDKFQTLSPIWENNFLFSPQEK